MSAAVSARDLERWLRRSDAIRLRQRGGHIIWRLPTGAIWPSTDPARSKGVGRPELGSLARHLGVPVRDLVLMVQTGTPLREAC